MKSRTKIGPESGGNSRCNPATLSAAYKLLEKRDYLSVELDRKLVAMGFLQSDVEEVVFYLSERKFLNDKSTTQRLIDQKSGKRSVGVEKLKAELEKRGVREELIEENVAELGDESTRALGALQAKYKAGADRAKAGRFLYGRGFDEEAIESALDQFFSE